MKFAWSRPALAHVQSISEFVAEHDPRAAARILDRIEASVSQLAHFSRMGRIGREPGTSELTVSGTPHIVSYRLAQDRIEILAVVHGARDWPSAPQ